MYGGSNCGFMPTALWYQPADLVNAWKQLLSAADELQGVESYEYDVVDLTRQVLSNLFLDAHAGVTTAFTNKNRDALSKASAFALGIMADMELVLSCDTHLILGKWVEDAKKVSTV